MSAVPADAACRAEADGPVLVVTIDRPRVLNALDEPTHHALAAIFDRFAADAALRVAILTGAGERAFCVGSDLKAKAAKSSAAEDMPASGFAGITKRFDCPKPIIAAVNGAAIGGGTEIVLACDLAVAADHATFGLPEPHVGLAALGGGGLQRLIRQISAKAAMDLILTGRTISAGEALRLGLIYEVVPRVELMGRARALADMIVRGAPLAIEASKAVALASLSAPDLETAIRDVHPLAARMLASEDACEGPKAFAEKRPPVWAGR